jgi:hypothetical protein
MCRATGGKTQWLAAAGVRSYRDGEGLRTLASAGNAPAPRPPGGMIANHGVRPILSAAGAKSGAGAGWESTLTLTRPNGPRWFCLAIFAAVLPGESQCFLELIDGHVEGQHRLATVAAEVMGGLAHLGARRAHLAQGMA